MADTLVFDPKKGHEAADALVSVCNGKAQESLVALWGQLRQMGEDNPIVDAPLAALKKIEAYFNEQTAPHANACKDHFMEYAEAAQAIQNTEAAKTADGAELGQLQDTTYDAAKNL